jgi:hypothetical protein
VNLKNKKKVKLQNKKETRNNENLAYRISASVEGKMIFFQDLLDWKRRKA